MPQHTEVLAPAGAAVALEQPAYDPATVLRHITHELRQPLSTIESIAFYLEMVLPRTEGKARRQLAKMQQEVRQIDWILSDAIHFLRAAPLQPRRLDLTEVVSRSLSEWNTAQGAGLCLRLERELPPVRLDLEQIQHMLRNIVGFFGRLSPPEHSMVLRTYAADDTVVLETTATTPECATAGLEPLFEPFDSHLPGGSGLGLASVRKIAEAHGARIEVHHNPAGTISLLVAFPAAR
jgi:signal transduction histidine kinase